MTRFAQSSRPPVILQVLPSLATGGAERGCVDVAQAIVAAGGRALVASSGGAMVRELDRAGASHVSLPLASKNPLTMRANVDRLSRLIEAEAVDIAHARSRAPAWSAYLAAGRRGVPFVTTFHAPYNDANRLKHWYNSVMARGRPVIAISHFIAAHVGTRYGVEPGRIRTIHRGVDLDRFDPARVSHERLIQLARQWRLPEGAPVILLAGRLSRWKGQALLIEALARLGRDDARVVLVGAEQGRAAYRRELEALALARGVAGQVHIAGDCRDMPAAYMLANVVVSASSDPEAFGRVMAEAGALGRPVVASGHGAAPEIVREGVTGWLFPPGDVAALGHALAHALDLDPDARRRLAVEARHHVARHFDKVAMCRATLDVYAEILAGRGQEAA
ncbi:MAG: glycosyltransferase [Alphaproteobacteria bacterium]|nr:glycosyltransferase [Alphaproteobacteria bacterium]